ncbi:putative holin-like toxin [Brevibacillus sp. Leaf182]|uniref:putative holin-like toxin n=1 Tax=Brevibacillus sp. Leaf182 TaxID=1736290 RepID=UPI00351AAF10
MHEDFNLNVKRGVWLEFVETRYHSCYNFPHTIETAPQGWMLTLYPKTGGGEAMEVYQTLTLMISFATLVVLILSFDRKKK